jgi:acylphosphatase
MAAITRARIVVSGRVQGIGFRYAARQWAVELNLTGWVRNLPDGRVEAVVEGDKPALDDLIRRLREGPPFAQVDDLDVEWELALGDFTDFQIIRFRRP